MGEKNVRLVKASGIGSERIKTLDADGQIKHHDEIGKLKL